MGKFIRGFPTDDGLIAPSVDIVSMYIDQVSDKDVGISLARRHGVRLTTSIEEALTLGTGSLAVDGVLSIGEHGQYPLDEIGRMLYPCDRLALSYPSPY